MLTEVFAAGCRRYDHLQPKPDPEREAPSMSNPSSHELTVNGHTIQRLSPGDAAGVARLVEVVYEDTYYPRDLYDPEQIIRLNEAGKLVSVVALDSASEGIGHYALERPHLEASAESSDAIVRPEHRHHHVME